MTTSCLTRESSSQSNANETILRDPLIPPPLSSAGTTKLWAQDLLAARNLINRKQYGQALVLAGALQRLHGDHHELIDLITTCRGHLGSPAK